MKLSTRVNYQTLSHNGEFRENLFNNCRTGPVALKGFVLYFHHLLTHLKVGVRIHAQFCLNLAISTTFVPIHAVNAVLYFRQSMEFCTSVLHFRLIWAKSFADDAKRNVLKH